MKENEPLETNMRPLPKNDNQKTIRKSYNIWVDGMTVLRREYRYMASPVFWKQYRASSKREYPE